MSLRVFFFGLVLLPILCSCEDILEVPDISEQEVVLLAPSDGTVLDVNIVNLNWKAVDEAEEYKVQVATPNFDNASQLVLDSIVKMDSLGYVSTQLHQNFMNGSYQWRVKAFNSGFETPYTVSGFQIMNNEDMDAEYPDLAEFSILGNKSEARILLILSKIE